MAIHKTLVTISFFCCAFLLSAQNHQERFESIDVQHYKFEIHLSDSSDNIEGRTIVSVKILEPAENLILDLIDTNSDNKGMIVHSVIQNGKEYSFQHKNQQIIISLERKTRPGEILDFYISYSGVPADGLVISKNSHGQRTFFGDNWPDRARHWLPTVDHPSDKATLEFKVYAPRHYEVISNGYLVERKELPGNMKFTHWKEDIPLSTKLMVIGVADFVVGNKTIYSEIPVSSWVFEKDTAQGLKNYKYGTEALDFFSELIGPYSFEKLAHVQSKTRYGGMENASCIFYHERTATSDQSQERLFAHEVAHQWFGNSVTEQNWHHVWLSEGFATYLTHVYRQHLYGEKIFREDLKNDRNRVIGYAKRKSAPIIDTSVTEYTNLLNTNSYQKAAWVLHMLREDLHDELFFKGLRKYYADFQNATALTNDFRNVMESVSGKDLNEFFEQWFWQAGHPVVNVDWKQKENQLSIHIKQTQKNIFSFPLDVLIQFENGSSKRETIDVKKSECSIAFNLEHKVKDIVLDPGVKLLFEVN